MPLFIVCEHDDHEPTNHHPVMADTPEAAAVEYIANRHTATTFPEVLGVVQYGDGPGYLWPVSSWLVEVKEKQVLTVEPR